MTENEYKEALSEDKEYVQSQLSAWLNKKAEAEKLVEYWEGQAKAINIVTGRANISNDTAFVRDKQ